MPAHGDLPIRSTSPRSAAARPLRAWAACLLVLVLGGTAWLGPDWRAWTADYRTAAGQTLPVQLADGSHVLLGSDSAFSLDYGPAQRRVRLLRGEALFIPAPRAGDETRPFVVQANDGQTTALGTQFVVRRDSAQQVLVGVLEHSTEVALREPPRHGEQRLALQAGQAARYDPAHGVTRLDAGARALADWTEGSLVFDQVPLDRVLARLDAFWPGRLMLLRGAQANTPVTALVHTDNLDQAVRTLCAQFQLKRLSLPGMTILY